MFSQLSQDDTIRDMVQIDSLKKCRLNTKFFIWNFYWAKIVPVLQKKCVWQVTTIIQPALCHLVTSHFQEIACNWAPKDQIRWPIFLMLLCMIVLTEKNVKISTTYYFLDFSFFMSQDDAHYQNHLNAPSWLIQYSAVARPGRQQRAHYCGHRGYIHWPLYRAVRVGVSILPS